MANKLDTKIETWKNKLLDLGKRNKLLNFKHLKRSTIKFETPNMLDLWDSFVENETPIIFPNSDDFSDTETVLDGTANIKDDKIITNLNTVDLQKTLRNLRDKSKTAMEEQGINALYLSFGILKWSESNTSDIYFNAPIILVPATLTVESITSPFVLDLHEDEIVVNPTLCYKLQNDFGITLPEFDEDEGIASYLDKISKLVSKNKWQVLDETWLSLLSFLKINMYNDLLKHKDRVINNLNVRAIGGESSASNIIPEEILNFDFDKKLNPTEIFQVVDADSSQQDAVLSAKKGYSFVLQGPPGTGKSQTITNIIAECLADGKKVLFVSEKMAALDVVYRRLHGSGLDDFCLILHSHKANKKEVLTQLGEVLNLAKSKASISDEAYQKLETLQRDKEKLNEYANVLHQKIAPLNKSVYQINGILANLETYEEVIFSLENVKETDESTYNRYNYLLENFVKTIGKMTDDYRNNPWYFANISSVSNELRHDIGAKTSALIPKIADYNEKISSLLLNFNLKLGLSYTNLHIIKEIFSISKNSPVVPINWIVGDEIVGLFDEISECEKIKREFVLKSNKLRHEYDILSEEIAISSVDTLTKASKIDSDIATINCALQSDKYLKNLSNHENLSKTLSVYTECKAKASELKNLEDNLLRDYEKEILTLDFKEILTRYKTEYTNVLKFFKGSYSDDKKTLKALLRSMGSKISDDFALKTLNSLKDISDIKTWFLDECMELSLVFPDIFDGYKSNFDKIDSILNIYKSTDEALILLDEMKEISTKIEEQEHILITHYEFLYEGINTDWEDIRKALTWAVSFRNIVEKHSINIEFINRICSDKDSISACFDGETEVSNAISDINIEFNWYLSLFDNNITIQNLKLTSLKNRLEKCQNGLYFLEEWIDFKSAKKECKDAGLSDYMDKIESLSIETDKVIPIFKKRFCRLWLDAILPDYPVLLNFRRRNQESIIEEFSSLDKMQFEIAKARIRSKLINELPSTDNFTSGVDEISILKRELAKQRKIMPIRKLFRAIPNLLLKLKPCLMMSPLSVSLFLEAETYMFDTVIFDEASQVCTENAIGAISRGKQVIIAGDSKQLPPTNFFGATISDTDYDDSTDEDDDDDYAYESVLDEANLLPERTLLWHYRSRHEHLIAFSNAKIYKNNLVTFPSNVDKVLDNGVEYIYVKDGYYDKGGKKGNVLEAKKVALMVFEHFKKHPNRSVGVVAFGSVQQQAIDTCIREMRMKNQEFEHFFKEDLDEPFFVKNLENVQGDERDTIIFSIGYAKDVNGVFRMNFGPLSKSGGERRLNVAITRAKYNVKLVGSILPTDINTDKITTDGPKLLKNYIDFAMNGVSVLNNVIKESDIVEHDSPFEKSVYDFLDRKGYKLTTQVGCSGYRIDMAVKHPTLSGQYILGIECDGASYHSARTARERDRLRSDVLEGMGWKIYRIWSTDWIKDQSSEGERLLLAIEEALKNYGFEEQIPLEEDEPEMEDFVSLDEKIVTEEEKQNPYGFESSDEVDFANLPTNSEGFLSITDCITEIVNKSFPVHYDLICKDVAPLFGNQKATVKVRREVDLALENMSDTLLRKGDFFFPKNYVNVLVHIPNTRKINHISPEEIGEVMVRIVSKCVGTTKDSLCLETARAFGFSRMTANIEESISSAFEQISSSKFDVVDGKINLKEI